MLFLNLQFHGYVVNEIFWGLWLLPLARLVYWSPFLPRFLGVWLALAGFAYVILSLTGVLSPQNYDKVFTFTQPAHTHPSFAFCASRMNLRDQTERADFFLPLRSCEVVGLRREKSFLLFHQPASFGEIAFMLWLVIKGARAVPTI
jgi:hypothetical protein